MHRNVIIPKNDHYNRWKYETGPVSPDHIALDYVCLKIWIIYV